MALKSVSKADPNFVPNYQLSGIPFVTSSSALGTSPVEIEFPFATKSVKVTNTGAQPIRFGFSAHGVNETEGSFYYLIPKADAGTMPTVDFDVRCKSVFLRSDSGTSGFALYAALTPVGSGSFPIITGSNGFEGVG